MRVMRALLVCLSLVIMSAGCTSAPAAPPYRPVADVKTLMASILEPAAEVYWDAVGIIVDEHGEQHIEPTTVEQWDAVRNAAYVVAESGNLLMMPKDAVFDVGAEVYDACTNCHAKYSPDIVRPNAR